MTFLSLFFILSMSMDKKLAKKIDGMAKLDQKMRREVETGGQWNYSIDKKNTGALKKIIRKHNWPTIELVGRKASNNAWLLVQHADYDKSFQKKVLSILNKIIKKNPSSIDKANIAYLTDRVLVAEGKKQLFGTQFYINRKNKLIPRSIRNERNVNERRVKYNLDPIEQYLADAKKYVPPGVKRRR